MGGGKRTFDSRSTSGHCATCVPRRVARAPGPRRRGNRMARPVIRGPVATGHSSATLTGVLGQSSRRPRSSVHRAIRPGLWSSSAPPAERRITSAFGRRSASGHRAGRPVPSSSTRLRRLEPRHGCGRRRQSRAMARTTTGIAISRRPVSRRPVVCEDESEGTCDHGSQTRRSRFGRRGRPADDEVIFIE